MRLRGPARQRSVAASLNGWTARMRAQAPRWRSPVARASKSAMPRFSLIAANSWSRRSALA